jgi:hypothetical protein
MCAQAVFGSPVRKLYGETVSLTTTAQHLLVMPTYHEVMLYCASAWRLGIAPRLSKVAMYAASAYTDYTTEAIDRVATTHVPLDGMTTAKTLYLGVTAPVRGFYINVATAVNAEAATLDFEYCHDVSGYTSTSNFKTLTGTISGALTVGETVTGSVSGATGTVVESGATWIVVKDVTHSGFAMAENAVGASQACNTITAIADVAKGTGYFTDVATDVDGTDSPAGTTLGVAGLYSFVLPAVKRGAILAISNEPLYWYRFTPSATLSTTVSLYDIIPACDTVNYAYMEGGNSYQFSINTAEVGAFEFDHTATGTLNVTWIAH